MREWLTGRPIAHRGLHDTASGMIENTATAFRAAIEGRYGIECDVQVSSDGEAIVYHDAELGRIAEGAGRLDAMPAAALQRAALPGTADRMLTLGELCDLVAGRVTLVVELKSRFDRDMRLPRRAAAVLAGYRGPAAAMSFDPGQVAALRDLSPGLARGLVGMKHDRAGRDTRSTASAARFAMQALTARLQFLAYRVQDLTSPIPVMARKLLGLPLLTWTVRTAEDRERAARHADQIIFEGFRP